jgi:D-xylulose reductase
MSVYNTGKMGLVSCSGSMCLGHESSGIIVQLGQNVAAQAAKSDERAAELAKASGDRSKAQTVVGSAALHLGDRVTLEPGTTCRMCTDCRNGRYQVSLWNLEHWMSC